MVRRRTVSQVSCLVSLCAPHKVGVCHYGTQMLQNVSLGPMSMRSCSTSSLVSSSIFQHARKAHGRSRASPNHQQCYPCDVVRLRIMPSSRGFSELELHSNSKRIAHSTISVLFPREWMVLLSQVLCCMLLGKNKDAYVRRKGSSFENFHSSLPSIDFLTRVSEAKCLHEAA